MHLLQIIWNQGPSNVDQVREALRTQGLKRSDSAIRTLLKIMVRKGLLTVKPGEYAAIYAAAVKRDKVEKTFFRHITNILFGGNDREFVLSMFNQAELDESAIKDIEQLLKEHKKK